MIKTIQILGIWVLLGWLWGGIGAVGADSARQDNITFDEQVEGSISNTQFRQLYSFEGRSGQVVTIRMQRQAGDLDPYLLLLTNTGDLIAVSDDVGGRNAEIASQLLPYDGLYTIIVTRFAHEHGTTEGDYTLTLESVGTSIAPANTTATANTTTSATSQPTTSFLRYGDEILGQIIGDNYYVIYRFSAQRGDVVNLTMTRINGDLDPVIDLFDPDGVYLLSGDDESGTLNAAIRNYTIPADGVYYVQATRYGRLEGTTTGLFSFQIAVVPTSELGTRPSNARVLALPSTVTSTITAETLTRFFQVEARRGDILSVIVTRTGGDLQPRASVLRSDLSQMATSTLNDDEDIATIGGVTVQTDGIYFISVNRANGQDGETFGEFSLQVERRPGIVAGSTVEIVYGGQVIGTINNSTVQESFVFAGRAGDVVTINMIRTNGDLDALLTLRDRDGKQLTANDDGYGTGSKDALISGYVLPVDGIYFIEASRYERTVGETSGDYVLQLTAVVAPSPTNTPAPN